MPARLQPACPPPASPALEAELARLAREYGRWITVNQISTEESCSIDTARRHLLSGAYGLPVDRQPGGGLRLLTSLYLDHRRTRLVRQPAPAHAR